MKNRGRMSHSLLEVNLPARTKNILIRMAAYHSGPVEWSAVVEAYKTDPHQFEVAFLRTPGAGRKSLEALKSCLKNLMTGVDQTGKVVWLTRTEVMAIKHSIDEVCHSTASDSSSYRTLRAFQHLLLTAEVIHTKL